MKALGAPNPAVRGPRGLPAIRLLGADLVAAKVTPIAFGGARLDAAVVAPARPEAGAAGREERRDTAVVPATGVASLRARLAPQRIPSEPRLPIP